MATIKAGTYRFNDVLTAPSATIEQELQFAFDVHGYYGEYEFNYHITGEKIKVGTNSNLIYTSSEIKDLLGYDSVYVYNDGLWESDAFGEGIQTITISEDTEVSDEFGVWYTANTKRLSTITYNGSIIASLLGGQTATLKCAGMTMESDVVLEVAEQSGGGGSTEIVDKAEAWFAKNFPSDTWSDGECTCTFMSIPVTVRYKYRTGNTNPKDIAIEGTIVDIDGTEISVTNLAEYYAVGLALKCGRMAVNNNSVLADTLYRNPVVITYADLSQLYSVNFGTAVTVTLSAMQASLKNYDGKGFGDVINNQTVASYFVKTSYADVEDETEARMLYNLNLITHCEWYYEQFEGSFAYCGIYALAKSYFTWT